MPGTQWHFLMYHNPSCRALAVKGASHGRCIRPTHSLRRRLLPTQPIRHPLPASSKGYATSNSLGSSSNSSRKAVTVVNDDGRVPWKDLRTGEKVARTAQQSFNFGVVLAGFVGTGLVMYFLYKEVFATDSKTRHFNRAVDRVRADARSLELLGSGKSISAFGEPTAKKWARARPIASSTRIDQSGAEHFKMHFNVEGSVSKGVVSLHMVKRPGESDYKYRYFVLDVPGYPKHYLENGEKTEEKKSNGLRMLGVKWK